MSRAYREMVERFPQIYGLEDPRIRWEQECLQAEHEAWLRDEQARAEYEMWLNDMDESNVQR